MIRNTCAVYINGINVTNTAVMPPKWANFLDEQLDEMYLGLRRSPFDIFAPLTPVEIHYTNALLFGSAVVDTETEIKYYLVADDSDVKEVPLGSGTYDHNLYIIELTKYLECIVVNTSTITNDIGRSYTKNAPFANLQVKNFNNQTTVVTPDTYRSPAPVGNFTFIAPSVVCQPYSGGGILLSQRYELIVTNQNNDELAHTYNDEGAVVNFQAGQTYQATYNHYVTLFGGSETVDEFIYTFVSVENEYPLKQWTITDVINRLCDIAEPIRQGETPRFILQGAENGQPYAEGSQAALFNNVLAPQFSFTKATFRECLKQCGYVIHGEPRIDIASNADGSFYYQISFDLFGQTKQSNIWQHPYIEQTFSQDIESYASRIDSSTENLVNQLKDYVGISAAGASGVITEPYAGGFKTVRTDTVYVRVTDGNMLIQTQYPIYSVERVLCGYIPENESLGTNIDITPYVFESSIYNTRMSSYDSEYPYSKAYGITYTQGQKNLTALNFKVENPISSVFENYAIINILRAATGDDSLSITGSFSSDGSYVSGKYPTLAFQITYTPFYNARVGQTKLNYGDYPYSAALVMNQQENVIESRYYGENLKGTIARLGNVEKSKTYILARLHEIPIAGQLYDADYKISVVMVEFMPSYIKCTIGLSKDFNRISQYIGISSVKRFSEVSQGQAIDRNTLWEEFVVIGDSVEADTDCYMGDGMLQQIANTFSQTAGQPLTNVAAWGSTYQNNNLPAVYLPVVSSAFGNAISFAWAYEDNYSAGAYASYQSVGAGSTQVDGYWQNNYQYTDYYGRMYYYNFDLQTQGPQATEQFIQQDITSQVTYQIASDQKSATLTIPNPNGYQVSLNYSVTVQLASGGTQSLTYTTSTTADTYTYNVQINGDITAVTINSAIMYVPDFIDSQTEIGLALPGGDVATSSSGYVSTVGQSPITLRKDNREALQCNFQINFVSNRKDLIVGSALAAYCPAIRVPDATLAAKLYVFNAPLSKFIDHVSGALNVNIETMQSADVTISSVSNGQFTVSAGAFIASGQSWAIVTAQTTKTVTVQDDEGNTIQQSTQYGGDVLIAQNMTVTQGDSFPTVTFTKKREIFNRSCWVNIL